MEKVNFLIAFLGLLLAISYHVYGARISVINEEKLSKGGQCDPHVNPFKTTFIPHPSDCSKFFMCQFGRSHETKCPVGLHFNIESSKCDYPALAKCKLIPSGSAAPPICPMFGFETKGIPKICSKYIECVHGRPYVRSCPASLFWSETGKRCDYAHKSECMKGNSVVSPGGDENEVTYTPDCPHVLDKDSFVAHPSDCTKYFQCWNGNAFVRHCPSGLHWNAVTNRCDWPFRANCSETTSTTTATEPTDNPTTESTGSPVIDTTQEPGEETTTDSSTTEISTSPPKPPATDAPGTETPGSEAPGTETTEEPGVDAPGIGEPETEAPETEAPETETPETEAPETEAPGTEAPETEVPGTETEIPGTEATETEEPETETPETERPGTAAPGTEAPETEAPETEVSVPEVPATELPETEAPETEAPGTDAPATEVPTSTTDPRINVSIPTFSTSPPLSHQTNSLLKAPQ
ncbi:mucin-5B-like, partial [Hermetia illucens]